MPQACSSWTDVHPGEDRFQIPPISDPQGMKHRPCYLSLRRTVLSLGLGRGHCEIGMETLNLQQGRLASVCHHCPARRGPCFGLAQRTHARGTFQARAELKTRSAATETKGRNHVFGLLSAVTQQVQKETIPFVRDLVQPLLEGNPPDLTDTVDPQSLADEDSRFLNVDGVTLHYKEHGPASPRAPAILLLHGWNGSVMNWEEVMKDLSEAGTGPEGCRVIAFDRPPFGLSQRPLTWQGEGEANPYTAEGGARLAWSLLDALGVGQVVVAGHSAGALVAAHMALRRPQQVAGLCCVAPALPSNRTEGGFTRSAGLGRQVQMLYIRTLLGMDGPGLAYVRRSITKQADRVRSGGSGNALHPDPDRQKALVDGYLKPLKAHDWDKGVLYAFRSFNFRPTTRMPYERITAPVQVILGDKEMSMLKTATEKVVEELQERPSGSTEFLQLEQCGHIPMDDQRDRFVAALRRFAEESLRAPSQARQAETTGAAAPDAAEPALVGGALEPVLVGETTAFEDAPQGIRELAGKS